MADEHKLHVEVLTPEGEVFDGEVQQVSTRTAVGEVGILANHAPLLAGLLPAELRLHVSDSETSATRRPRAGCRCSPTGPGCWSSEAIPPEELDAADAAGARSTTPSSALARPSEGSAAYDQAPSATRTRGRGVLDRRG